MTCHQSQNLFKKKKKSHRGDIFRGELVGGVGYEEAGFTHGSVTDYYTLK
jgi:hypothetical protein